VSPPRRKSDAPRRANRNHTSPAAVGDLQGLVDQVQALRRRHKAQPSPQAAAELARLRQQLLEALDLDEDDAATDEDSDAGEAGEFLDDETGYGRDMGGGRVRRVSRPEGLVPLYAGAADPGR
jgi:hypothetical protein